MIKDINNQMITNQNELKSKFEFNKSIMSKSNISQSKMSDKTPARVVKFNKGEMSPFTMLNPNQQTPVIGTEHDTSKFLSPIPNNQSMPSEVFISKDRGMGEGIPAPQPQSQPQIEFN